MNKLLNKIYKDIITYEKDAIEVGELIELEGYMMKILNIIGRIMLIVFGALSVGLIGFYYEYQIGSIGVIIIFTLLFIIGTIISVFTTEYKK